MNSALFRQLIEPLRLSIKEISHLLLPVVCVPLCVGVVLSPDQWYCFLGDLVVHCGTLTCTGILSVLEPGALVCELYHLIFDAIFLFIPQFYITVKILPLFVKPVLVLPVPAIVGVFESVSVWCWVGGFCLCNVSMVRLYFVFFEYCGVSVHDESPSSEIEVH